MLREIEGDDENADRGMSTDKLTFSSLPDNNPEGLRQAGGWIVTGRYHLNQQTHLGAELPQSALAALQFKALRC